MGNVTKIHDGPKAHVDRVNRFDPGEVKRERLCALIAAETSLPEDVRRLARLSAWGMVGLLADPTFWLEERLDQLPSSAGYIAELLEWEADAELLVRLLEEAGVIELVAGYVPAPG